MSLQTELRSSDFSSATKTSQVHLGMPCRYTGSRRRYGLRGVVVAKSNGSVTIKWDNCDEQQMYNANGYAAYLWSNVEFYLQYQQVKQKETQMQTVNLLTVGSGEATISIEVTPHQAALFESTTEGAALSSAGIASVTKAIKQDGQYFALNPLKVNVPKVSSGVSERPLSIT